jgi:uncharacterized membrane protein (DUF106 family)
MTRNTDMIDEQKFYTLEHKVSDLQKDMTVLQDRVKEDHSNLRTAIKDLAESQKELADGITKQSLSMTKLETSLQTIAKAITWFFPILVTVISLVIGGIWTLTQATDTKQPEQVILQQPQQRR